MRICHCSEAKIGVSWLLESENCTSPNGLLITAYCFQSTEFKTLLLTVLCLRQKCQVFSCAKHGKCKSHVYTKREEDYSFICTSSTELTNSISTQKSEMQLLMPACMYILPNCNHCIKYT